MKDLTSPTGVQLNSSYRNRKKEIRQLKNRVTEQASIISKLNKQNVELKISLLKKYDENADLVFYCLFFLVVSVFLLIGLSFHLI